MGFSILCQETYLILSFRFLFTSYEDSGHPCLLFCVTKNV